MALPRRALERYLDRTGLSGVVSLDLGGLARAHEAHLAHIPFENIDVLLGRSIRLDLESLLDKLVERRRGGYCFEHNTLFAAVLRTLGFEVETLEARVRPPGATATLPRTHMTLRVALEGRGWLADVGFGGDGPLSPVPFDGEVSEQEGGAYRVTSEVGGARVLQRQRPEGWSDLYAFSLSPALPVDFEVANHFTSTHPGSIFRRTLTVQRTEPAGRRILRGRSYAERRGDEESHRDVSDGELSALLEREFGLELVPDDVALLESRA